jgi:Mrp family chromosome partitioning ATPase
VRSALQVRADQIVPGAEAAIDRIDLRLVALAADDPARAELASQRDQLRAVVTDGDPTLTLSQAAIPPPSAVGASPVLIVALAALAGFVLGSGTALLMELLARRVRDPEDAFQLYPLPVLAHVPELPPRRLRGPPDVTWFMPPEVREPLRTLALQFDALPGSNRAVMVTSPSSGDGKTSSAINLAVSLAASRKDVILLDFDLRNPQVGNALGIEGRDTIADLLEHDRRLDRLLFRASDLSLRVLPLMAAPEEADLIDVAGLRLPALLKEARALADHVVIDTAPLGEVGDALTLAREVDDVIVVIRPGNTNRGHLRVMRDLLEGVGKMPTGYLLIGRVQGPSRGYYSYGSATKKNLSFTQRGARASETPREPPDRDGEDEPESDPDEQAKAPSWLR